MKKSDEFLDSLGLKRKTKDSRKELSEVMRRTQWGNYTGSKTTPREVDESTATQVLHLAFEEWGFPNDTQHDTQHVNSATGS